MGTKHYVNTYMHISYMVENYEFTTFVHLSDRQGC